MKISRRNFVGALSGALAVVFPIAGAPDRFRRILGKAGSPVGASALFGLDWRSFYPYLHTEFNFHETRRRRGSDGMVRLTLSAMSQSEDLQGSDRTPECFVLTFTGPAGGGNPRLMQNTYSVEHFALGRFDLFISEGALIGTDHVYTAVINRVAG